MSVQHQVSDQNVPKIRDVLRSQLSSSSSSVNPLTHQWGDSGDHFVSLQSSIEARMKELQIKETQVSDRLRELESKEREIMMLRNIIDLDWGLGSVARMEGQKLLAFLSESLFEQEKLCECVHQELELSEDPGKLVLYAVGEFFCENVELGFGSSVRKRSCVVLLEQLAKLGPKIAPAVKAEAARLAREWRAKIRTEGQRGVLDVLGFLLLLGAYDLVDEFDSGEMLSVLQCIGQQNRQVEAGDLRVELGIADNDAASTSVEVQEKTKQSLEEDLELVNQIASAFTSPFDALKCFCVGMDGRNLKLFLYQYVEEHDSWSAEVREALSHAPDPSKLVLDAIPGFLRSQPEFHKSLLMAKVRKSCILLLEQLMTMSPQISPDVREEALKLADEWGSNLGQIYQRPITVYGFLLFVAAYGFKSKYEADELLRLLGISSQYKVSPGLCQALGLANKAEDLIRSLIQKTQLLEAVDNVYAYNLVDKFPPVRLLKGYLNYSKKRIYKKGNQSSSQQKQAMNKEIACIRTVIKYIAKYKLESKYPPKGLEKQILELEKKKAQTNDTAQMKKPKATNVPIPDVSCASTIVDSQVTVEPSPIEDFQWDNQVSSISTCPWPQLESFCISTDGRGSSFFSQSQEHMEPVEEHMEEHNLVASSSSSPWSELRSFCVNMDGKSLRQFLYDHMQEHDSFCSEVSDALQYAYDPAKLVLDAIPGCLRSQPEFDKSLSVNRVRKSCILLLEQLLTMSPQISPLVKEDALKMANEWRANLGQKYQTPVNVYGFLHFIAAYGLASNYEAEELLGFLPTANQHKASPGLCRTLGLADKIVVLIENLKQKNLLPEAIEHIYAFAMVDKFPPVRFLKDYLTYAKKKICKYGTKSPSKQAIDKEITAVRSVIKCITKFKLESKYPPEDLEKHIAELERQKSSINDTVKFSSSQNAQA